jgi:hypothetical protein
MGEKSPGMASIDHDSGRFFRIFAAGFSNAHEAGVSGWPRRWYFSSLLEMPYKWAREQ